jgi:phosphoribosyl 1,2-cyclic phosphate phosphodiesterase
MSDDPRDKRLRTSAIVRYQGARILIDCGPDFRTQMLRASDDNLDAVLLTHIHFDHVAGLDDLRAYCFERPMPLYARADVVMNLHKRIPYCFAENPYPGVPQFDVHVIDDDKPFLVEGVRVEPIPVMHYKLPILGFRIGPLAYITDAKTIDDEVVESLSGVPLLVINSLRVGEHISHMCLDETLAIVKRVKPGRTLLIHMSDRMGLHAESPKLLPQGVELAYDGLIVKV